MNYYESFINVQHVPELKNKKAGDGHSSLQIHVPNTQNRSLADMVEEFESKIIKQALNRFNGNKTVTAKELGLSVRNLYYKLEKYNLEKNSVQ
jgi:transcriptional regulator with PAS, ATPase and Fis domain